MELGKPWRPAGGCPRYRRVSFFRLLWFIATPWYKGFGDVGLRCQSELLPLFLVRFLHLDSDLMLFNRIYVLMLLLLFLASRVSLVHGGFGQGDFVWSRAIYINLREISLMEPWKSFNSCLRKSSFSAAMVHHHYLVQRTCRCRVLRSEIELLRYSVASIREGYNSLWDLRMA